MKKTFFVIMAFGVLAIQSKAQLSRQEFNYVTMDLQGVLNLTMSTDPSVNFSFKSINDYQNGIMKFNATTLNVDATVPWALFAYASTDNWVQVNAYSANGVSDLPAEILEIQSNHPNPAAAANNLNTLASLKGLTNSGVSGGIPAITTQFLSGMAGSADATLSKSSTNIGTAASNPVSNQFRVHYRLKPGIPASFPNSAVSLAAPGFAQAGYYYLEVVYSLVEDL